MDTAIEIIGTESLGVRGLSCLVTIGTRRIVIDPGVALGYNRHNLLPHPLQVAEGERVRKRIIEVLQEATDVVLSHYHGDHIPLREANPYQLAISQLPTQFPNISCWAKSLDDQTETMKQRALDLRKLLGQNFHLAEVRSEGPMTFSKPMPHGTQNSKQGTVMMTRINLGDRVFVHTSDIQLLDAETIDFIIGWKADVVLAGGPPLYLGRLNQELRKVAWKNSLRLAGNVETLILDHHLMRDEQGPVWLEDLSAEVGRQVYCAADFMEKPRLLLEGTRIKLYETMPVPPDWHEQYEQGLFSARTYLSRQQFQDGKD